MLNKVKNHLKVVVNFSPQNADELEQFRIKFLGKNGIMNELFTSFKKVPGDQKKILDKY
jgi:phenylalanyl-tRNA synthetase alpha chain